MKIQKKIDVRLVKKGNQDSLRVVQYDTGVQLVFNILDFDLPDGTTVTLYIRKKSGKFVYQETGITVSGNTVTVNLENQALTEHGEAFYQLRFINGSDVLSTFSGTMQIDRSLADADAVESSTVIAAFEAKTAEQIAAIEAAAQEQIEVIRNLYNTYATKNEAANAIKGYMSGAVVVADDVSIMEHSPVVWVHGKNLIPYPYPQTTYTGNGGTFTAQADGGILASGTPTDYVSLNLYNGAPLAKSGNLVFSASGNYENVSISMVLYDSADNVLFNAEAWKGRNPISVNLDEYPTAVKWLVFIKRSSPNVEMTGKIYPQVELSDAATEYTPYIDPSTVKVRRCGKNIFGVAAKSQTINGVTFTVNTNGSVTATGTAEKTTFIGLGSLVLKPDEKYRLSGSPSGSGFDTYLLYIHNNTTGADIYDLGEGKVFTGKDGDLGVTIAVYAGNTVNNLTFRPMVVYGEESGDFEPYNGTSYTPTADGTVYNVTSLSPNMTILTDTDGAIVECEYNIDTKIYIDRKISELMKGSG